jgi:hypothetical protein
VWKVGAVAALLLVIAASAAALVLQLRYGPDGEALRNYEETRGWIRAERERLLATASGEARLAAVQALWIRAANDRIFPAWYGTPYDFNGTAEVPVPGLPGVATTLRFDRERKIACGHFVGSVMQSLGFNMDREAVGRQASGDIIRTFVADVELIHSYRDLPVSTLEEKIEELGPGIFLVGLDRHAGFIVSDESGLYFVHASGYLPFCVVREPVRSSISIRRSRLVMVGKFTADRDLAVRWLNGQEIRVRGGR